jgi:hypothetical protein
MLASVADLKGRLRMPATVTEQDAVLEGFLLTAQENILDQTGFVLGTSSATVSNEEIRNAQLGRTYTLKYRPLLPIGSTPLTIVRLEARALGSNIFSQILGEIRSMSDGVVLPLASDISPEVPPFGAAAPWFKWRQVIWDVLRVTYKVDHLGSSTNPVPQRLSTACIEWALSMYARPGGGAIKTMSIERVSETYRDEPVPDVVRSLLARYIRDTASVI